MRVEDWQSVGIVCGAILAALTLVNLVWRKVVRPVWRAAWKTIRRLNQVADDLLGEPARDGRPARKSLIDRVAGIEKDLAEHKEWHGAPGGMPARQVPQRPNRTGH